MIYSILMPVILSMTLIGINFFIKKINLRKPSLIEVHIAILIFFQLIGSYLLVNGYLLNNWWVSRAHYPTESIENSHLLLVFLLPIFLVSLFFIKVITKGHSVKLFEYYYSNDFDRNFRQSRFNHSKAYIVGIAMVVSQLVALILLVKLQPENPLFLLFQDVAPEYLKSARVEATSSSLVLKIIYEYYAQWLSPFITLFCYSLMRFNISARSRFIFLLSVILTVLIVLYRGEKAPIIGLFVMFVLLKGIYNHGISFGQLIKFLFMFILLSISMYVVLLGHENIFIAMQAIFQRIFISQHVGLIFSVEFYGNFKEFKGGYGFMPLSSFLFSEQHITNYALELMEEYNYVAASKNLVGYLSTIYIGEAYANWGIVGYIVSVLWIPFFFYIISLVSYHFRDSIIGPSLFSVMTWSIPIALNSGFRLAVYSPHLIGLVLFCFIVSRFIRK